MTTPATRSPFTSRGARPPKRRIVVFDKALTDHGVPQHLLSDNGLALNPSRRGYLGQLVVHVMSLGVEPITGKPYKPTTQGKNERFHQTLFRYLDKQPLAESLAELQAQVDAFDHITTPSVPPGTTRTRHTPDGVAGHREGRSTPPHLCTGSLGALPHGPDRYSSQPICLTAPKPRS
jgi:putative transposase